MTNKQAYIEYKNSNLFTYVKEEDETVPLGIQTRSKIHFKME